MAKTVCKYGEGEGRGREREREMKEAGGKEGKEQRGREGCQRQVMVREEKKKAKEGDDAQ